METAFTAITAYSAIITDQNPFFSSAAHKSYRHLNRLKLNYMLWAHFNTFSAALTFFAINNGYSFHSIYMNSIERTYSYTGTKSKSGILACFVAIIHKTGGDTILDSAITEFVFAMFQISLT